MLLPTIFALSSGLPPAGIAVIRISGPCAARVLNRMAGGVPRARTAKLTHLRHPEHGDMLDQAIILWFPGPASVTGDDLAEFHVHGGRAVVAAILAALGEIEGLRPAQAGEFTRRAFENGRIDLTQTEGLADLLRAESEWQRRSALALAEGQLGRQVARWQAALLTCAAQIEADLDFGDEDDVAAQAVDRDALAALRADIASGLGQPGSSERLRDGIRVVLGGPPNAGKSSLFNYLVGRDAAIVTDIPGTTRDVIEAPVISGGIAFLFIDTAGVHDAPGDCVEQIGIDRAGQAMAAADIILWLGPARDMPGGERSILVGAKYDLGARPGLAVSMVSGAGLTALHDAIVARARTLLPAPGALALTARHQSLMRSVIADLGEALAHDDSLIIAEYLRRARASLDQITGRAGVEDMLDTLFSAFCIGK